MKISPARLAAEKDRLRGLVSESDANKLGVLESLIDRLAYITILCQELEKTIKKGGPTEPYENGGGQKGIKQTAEAQLYVQLNKDLTAKTKLLLDQTPEAEKKTKSRIEAFLDGDD